MIQIDQVKIFVRTNDWWNKVCTSKRLLTSTSVADWWWRYVFMGLFVMMQIDEALYDFVVAKMCSRLKELNLLRHPAVATELGRSALGERWGRGSWWTNYIKNTVSNGQKKICVCRKCYYTWRNSSVRGFWRYVFWCSSRVLCFVSS